MKRVFIVGGNGFARECYNMLIQHDISFLNKQLDFGGFLGHGGYGHTVDYKSQQHLYKGEADEYSFSENDYIIIGAGFPELRKKIYDDMKKMGLKFYNLISYKTHMADSVKIGEANVLGYPFTCTVDTEIGCGNVFNGDVIIGHDAIIGNFNFVGPRTQILGNVQVGNMNEIGANSLLLPKSKIGSNNKIAPLSAIYKGCKNNCYMAGNPALKIGSTEYND